MSHEEGVPSKPKQRADPEYHRYLHDLASNGTSTISPGRSRSHSHSLKTPQPAASSQHTHDYRYKSNSQVDLTAHRSDRSKPLLPHEQSFYDESSSSSAETLLSVESCEPPCATDLPRTWQDHYCKRAETDRLFGSASQQHRILACRLFFELLNQLNLANQMHTREYLYIRLAPLLNAFADRELEDEAIDLLVARTRSWIQGELKKKSPNESLQLDVKWRETFAADLLYNLPEFLTFYRRKYFESDLHHRSLRTRAREQDWNEAVTIPAGEAKKFAPQHSTRRPERGILKTVTEPRRDLQSASPIARRFQKTPPTPAPNVSLPALPSSYNTQKEREEVRSGGLRVFPPPTRPSRDQNPHHKNGTLSPRPVVPYSQAFPDASRPSTSTGQEMVQISSRPLAMLTRVPSLESSRLRIEGASFPDPPPRKSLNVPREQPPLQRCPSVGAERFPQNSFEPPPPLAGRHPEVQQQQYHHQRQQQEQQHPPDQQPREQQPPQQHQPQQQQQQQQRRSRRSEEMEKIYTEMAQERDVRNEPWAQTAPLLQPKKKRSQKLAGAFLRKCRSFLGMTWVEDGVLEIAQKGSPGVPDNSGVIWPDTNSEERRRRRLYKEQSYR